MVEPFIEAARYIALGQMVLLSLLVLAKYRTVSGYLLLLNCVGIGAYILMPIPSESNLLLEMLGTSIPTFLWLIAYRFFSDEGLPPWGIWPWWLAYLGLVFMQPIAVGELGDFIHRFVPQVMKLILVLHVIYMALSGRRDDLIENRLKLRVPASVLLGSTVLLVIVTELWLQGPAPEALEIVWSAVICLLALYATVTLLEVRTDFPLLDAVRGESPAVEQTEKAASTEIQERVRAAMHTERFYANHGATLADLAASLDVQEYRLRRVINQEMGYANFNRFLNEYRVAEASSRLLEQDLPVVSIALDVGFKSLSSFNKAFKDSHRMTPTAYRQQKH